MKNLLIILILISSKLFAQSDLKFNKRFIDSENKWVSIPRNVQNTFDYGFIYLDTQAGLTLNLEGSYTISDDGKFVATKVEKHKNVLFRLQPNNTLVAHIPSNRFKELKIDSLPNRLQHYKSNDNDIDRLFRLGYTYNAWYDCPKALSYLEKVKNINPNYTGLGVEMAFSYNCMKAYDKAEVILQEELKKNPNNSYVNKEYIFALVNNKNIDKAIQQYNTAKNTVKDTQWNADNCYNILGYFYFQKDKINFEKWEKEFFSLNPSNKQAIESISYMKAEVNK